MQAMRRSAASVVSHGSSGPAARGPAAQAPAAQEPAARGADALLRAAVLGLIALIAAASAVLVWLAATTGPAGATVASAPRSTLASVIPSTAIPQSTVTFAVYCASARATSATLTGRTLGLTEHIKMRPNPAAGDFTVAVLLPGSIQPGTYYPSIKCSDGTSTTARLLVPALGAAGSTSHSVATWLTAVGLALIGLGTVTRSIVLRRRKRGDPGDGDPGDGGPGDGDPGSLSPLDRWQQQAARSRYFLVNRAFVTELARPAFEGGQVVQGTSRTPARAILGGQGICPRSRPSSHADAGVAGQGLPGTNSVTRIARPSSSDTGSGCALRSASLSRRSSSRSTSASSRARSAGRAVRCARATQAGPSRRSMRYTPGASLVDLSTLIP